MAKSIMIQGTMSNAGKSFLAAGLCRIFRQDGYRVAPFKSQNMALNSFITEDGLEMGRAQVVQAEAAGIRPEACMNPVLLKPTSQMGSQVIVNGRVLGTYSAADYYRMKKGLIPKVMEAYHSLEERFDVIVIEGAGSPAEINLREHDFVNMGLAELTDSPVLLAGDIDRGGVFAQLYGTAALLEEQERKRIRAFLINKFRGDPEILTPGLSMLYKRIPIPVAGVIPYLDVDLEDEDSLSERLSGSRRETGLDVYGRRAFGRVAVIRLPRISNFTDFHALERLPGIALFYASRPEEVANADFIVIPGTKNTMGDLKWMRESGMEAAVLRKAGSVPIMGICGGFQILGEELSDPFGVEEGGSMRGMGLLPVKTYFSKEKTTSQVMGQTAFLRTATAPGQSMSSQDGYGFGGSGCGASGHEMSGYEIHMGETVRTGGTPFSYVRECSGNGKSESCHEDGCVQGQVFGTYVHGCFDSEAMQTALWQYLAEQKGISETMEFYTAGKKPSFSLKEYKEEQYEKLARCLREHLDMDLIYRILDKKA